LPVLAAGETMGKVAADFVDIIVNDLFMPLLYKLCILLFGKNDKIETVFKSVKKEIDGVYVFAGLLKFILAVVAVYVVLGVILNQLGRISK
jgi:hypothetical protein